jgi:hypothetical protein
VTEEAGEGQSAPDARTSAGVKPQRAGRLQRPIDTAAYADSQTERDAERPYGDNLVEGYVPEEDGVDHRVEPKLWLTDGSDEGAPGGSTSAQGTSGDPAGDADPLAELPVPGDSVRPGATPAPAPDAPSRGQDVPPYPGQQVPYESPEPYELPAGSPGSGGPAGQPAMYGAPPAPQAAYSAPPVPDAGYGPAGPQTLPAAGDGFRSPPHQPQVPPYPAQVPSAPSPGLAPSMAARVTAPFAALTKSKGRKPARSRGPARPGPVPPGPTALKERVAAAVKTGNGPATAKAGNVPRGAPPTRRAQLVLARIEPWSVMKFSFMISLVGWVILFVAVTALYYVLNKLGVFHSIQSTITDVTSSKGSAGSDANGQWFSASRILGYTMLIGAVNVVLITALATVGAVIYNLVTHLAGGIEVTLKETD